VQLPMLKSTKNLSTGLFTNTSRRVWIRSKARRFNRGCWDYSVGIMMLGLQCCKVLVLGLARHYTHDYAHNNQPCLRQKIEASAGKTIIAPNMFTTNMKVSKTPIST